MTRQQLALFGGNKTLSSHFKRYNTIGNEEIEAATRVIRGGVLSQFLGSWHPDFYGGPKVREFERKCEEYFSVKHAVTVNSWTSGLVAAVGSIGIEPGDEVIVTPWSMCASATSILQWNAIPVFADIDPETFCIDPVSVEANITPHTRAIMAVDIFGHPSDMDSLLSIAKKYDLKVISDTAQSPGAYYKGKMAGTLADVGGFSLNYHKHIHTGEGGILVTNNDEYANKLQLLRNHAEAVVGPKGESDLVNMIGSNFRLGEIECAIGIEQLTKLEGLILSRVSCAAYLIDGLSGLRGLRTPITKSGCTHAYYMFPMVLDSDCLGVSRELIVQALEAEGVPGLSPGYANIHMLPMFQRKIAYGSLGFPWSSDICRRDVMYTKGICPVAETLHEKTYLGFSICLYNLTREDLYLLIEAFRKVWDSLDLLAHYQRSNP